MNIGNAGGLKNDVDAFFAYVSRTYVGTTYVHPTFSIAFWSVHQRVLDNAPRTNNSVEVWNRRIGALSKSSHLPLCRIIKILREEQHSVSAALAAKICGRKKGPEI